MLLSDAFVLLSLIESQSTLMTGKTFASKIYYSLLHVGPSEELWVQGTRMLELYMVQPTSCSRLKGQLISSYMISSNSYISLWLPPLKFFSIPSPLLVIFVYLSSPSLYLSYQKNYTSLFFSFLYSTPIFSSLLSLLFFVTPSFQLALKSCSSLHLLLPCSLPHFLRLSERHRCTSLTCGALQTVSTGYL